jgi:acetyltransferase-like isoleucine patch superfamily enzyme
MQRMNARARQLLFDLVTVAMLALVTGPALIVTGIFLRAAWPLLPPALAPLALVPALLVFCAMVCIDAFVVRLPIGRLRPGRYPLSSAMTMRWALLFALQRVLYLPMWRNLIMNIAALRWLCLRALGGRSDYTMQIATDAMLLDVCLLDIGPGTMIAGHSTVSGHFLEEGHLVLGAVRVEKDAQVLEGVRMGIDVVVGEGAVIGPECRLAKGVHIGARARLGPAVVILGPCAIEEGAVIGSHAQLEPGVTVGRGARVAARALVPRGTTIAAEARFPEERPAEQASSA